MSLDPLLPVWGQDYLPPHPVQCGTNHSAVFCHTSAVNQLGNHKQLLCQSLSAWGLDCGLDCGLNYGLAAA